MEGFKGTSTTHKCKIYSKNKALHTKATALPSEAETVLRQEETISKTVIYHQTMEPSINFNDSSFEYFKMFDQDGKLLATWVK